MHSVCLFPGLNAIARERDRSRFLALPTVQKYLATLQPSGYCKWLYRPAVDLYKANDFTALAALTLAIQTGIFEHICHKGFKPDLLIGCSLGDLSRTVCCGALKFEDAIELISYFEMIIGNINAGVTYSVRLAAGQYLDNKLLNELRDINLDPSILSSRHLIVGCDTQDEKKLVSVARERNWQIKKSPFQFALHSRHLIPLVEQLEKQFELNLSDPQIPVFSTYNLDVIKTADGLHKEAWQCFCTPMQWVNSLRELKKEYNVQRYINIGPCMSLPLLLRETDLDIKMENISL